MCLRGAVGAFLFTLALLNIHTRRALGTEGDAFGRKQGASNPRVDPCYNNFNKGRQKSHAAWQRCSAMPSPGSQVLWPKSGGDRLELFVVHVQSQVAKRKQMMRTLAKSPLLSKLKVNWVGVDARKRDVARE